MQALQAPSYASQLETLLRDHKDALLQRWARAVLDDPRIPSARRFDVAALRDPMPQLIDYLVAALGRRGLHPGPVDATEAAGAGAVVMIHARARVAQRYSVDEALRELSHLRDAVIELCCQERVALECVDAQLVHAVLDEAMSIEAIEMARKSAEFRERFIGILGHDLRNPLSSITFTAATLGAHPDLPDDVLKGIRRIATNADRITRMIADILDLTRSRLGGGIPIQPVPADLGAICRQVIDELEVAHGDRTIVFSAEASGQGVWDPHRLAQVVSNLVSNAIAYSPSETLVSVALHESGESIALSVTNFGPPIPPEGMTTLFDPFQRAARSAGAHEPSEGLGLGLFIAEQIVHAHGGSIEVVSDRERGTTFTVSLPRGAATGPSDSA